MMGPNSTRDDEADPSSLQVFCSSPWIPVEWIKAHGLEPRGVWSRLGPYSHPLAEGVCAFAQSVLHLASRDADSAVVFTSHCDQMRRAFDTVVSAGRSRVFLFNLPTVWQSTVAGQMFRSELERLGRFLARLGGHAPTSQGLAEVMTRYGQARKRLVSRALKCSSRQYAEAVARFHWDGSIHLPRPTARAPEPPIPLAVVGGPLSVPQLGLLNALEAAGGRVVLNATETGERSLLPAFPGKDLARDPVGLLSHAYLENGVDVFQRPNTRLYSWLRTRLLQRQVRGIVLWHDVGCDLWRAEAAHLREAFGLPLLQLDGNGMEGCSARDVNRIQAFVELLR